MTSPQGEKMKVIYTEDAMPEKFSKSIFLAGPTPRNPEEQESWRPDAIEILRDKGYDGIIFVPEGRDGKFKMDYDDQIAWEEKYLNIADVIMFWVPRDISPDSKGNPKMAAFTTNVEFGAWVDSGKIVWGAPPKSDKNTYLQHYAEEYKVPCSTTLAATLDDALEMLEDGAEREGGERFVPFFLWKQPSFQAWYQAQIGAGNRLEEARLLYTFRPSYKSFVFLWVLKAKMYVASEDRFKENEFVLSRPDISSICLYNLPDGADKIFDHEIVIVKEFRTPSSSEDGFVRELPSGSAPTDKNPEDTAIEELHEETGFMLESKRLKYHGARQLAGTFSAHQAHLYSAEIDQKEMEWFRSQKDIAHGKEEDTERTFVEVYNVQELLNEEIVDWTTLGMILSVIGH